MPRRVLFTGRSHRLNGTVEEATDDPTRATASVSQPTRQSDGVTSHSFGIQCADGSVMQMNGMTFPDGYFDDERQRGPRRSRRDGSN